VLGVIGRPAWGGFVGDDGRGDGVTVRGSIVVRAARPDGDTGSGWGTPIAGELVCPGVGVVVRGRIVERFIRTD
jgi:hypothetical protein